MLPRMMSLHEDRWRGAEIREILSRVFPFVIETLKRHQALERAIFQRMLSDESMRQRMSGLRRHVMNRVSTLLLARSHEINHSNPRLAVSFGVGQAGALLTEYYTLDARESEIVSTSDQQIAEELTRSLCSYLSLSEPAESLQLEGITP